MFNFPKPLLRVFFISLLMIFMGIGFYFFKHDTFDADSSKIVFGGYLLVALGIFVFVYAVYQYLKDPKAYIKKISIKQVNIFKQDINAFKLIFKNPLLFFSFISSFTLGIAGALFTERVIRIILADLSLSPFVKIFIGLFSILFVFFSFYLMGYMIMGEIFQRQLSHAKRSFVLDIFINFVYSIPFTIILTFFGVIFILFSSRDNDQNNFFEDIGDMIRGLHLYALFVAFKYYTYINLAMISYGDRSISFQDSYQMLKKEKKVFFNIFARAGIVLGLILFFILALEGYNLKFHLVEEDLIIEAMVVIGLLYIVFAQWSEQTSMLLHYIKTKYPETAPKLKKNNLLAQVDQT